MADRMVEPLLKTAEPNPPWNEARVDRLERDGHQCQAAAHGLTSDCTLPWLGLEVHHRLPRGRGGSNHWWNLVTLCAGHHRWCESNRDEAYDLGLLTRSS